MTTPRLFPAFIAVDEVPPLVIGNAALLEPKIRLLCKFAPLVEVVTDLRPTSRLGRHEGARCLAGVSCRDAHDLIAGRPFVILDTLDGALNASLSATAKAAGVPVNVPDNTALCSAYLGAIVDRSPVLVAISTGGAAPVIGQRIRARIESMLPAGFGKLATYLHRRRTWLRGLSPARRRALQHRVVEGPAAAHVLVGDTAAADRRLEAMITDADGESGGEVRIVDVGVGDPGLLSLRGVEAIRNADLTVHRAGLEPAIIDLARREAEIVTLARDSGGEALGPPAGRLSVGRLSVGRFPAERSLPEPSLPERSLPERLAAALAAGQNLVLLQERHDPDITSLGDRLAAQGLGGAVIPAAVPPNIPSSIPPGIPDPAMIGPGRPRPAAPQCEERA